MEIGEIIARQDKIIVGKQQLFIAKRDFSFFGVPILKDALVYYNGLGELRVNLVLMGVFSDSHVPRLVLKKLTSDINFYYAKKASHCPMECTELDKGSWGIWHTNHFDGWDGYFQPYADRIAELPVLHYRDIYFSALMYNYNVSRQTLDWFITADTSKLDTDTAFVEVPAGLEVSKYPTLSCYDIVPVSGISSYKNIPLEGLQFVSTDGIVSGTTAEKQIFINNNRGGITRTEIPKGSKINIATNGDVKFSLPVNSAGI
jgi:hypothetical protein